MPKDSEMLPQIANNTPVKANSAEKPQLNTPSSDPLGADASWLEPEKGRKLLKEKVADFFDETISFLGEKASLKQADPEPIAVGLKVSAGLGKTRSVLEAMAKQGPALLEHGHIFFYVPTLDLAERAADDFARLNSGLPQIVLRGRGAPDPDAPKDSESSEDTQRMCKKHELAESLAGKVSSVRKALCYSSPTKEKRIYSKCAKGCAYLWQGGKEGNKVVFLAHNYLAMEPPIFGKVALRIIDEKIWSTFKNTIVIHTDRWETKPAEWPEETYAELHDAVCDAVLEALKTNSPLLESIRRTGVDRDRLLKLADFEIENASLSSVHPEMDFKKQKKLIEDFDSDMAELARDRAEVFRILADVMDRDQTERISFEHWNEPGNKVRASKIKAHRWNGPQIQEPTLLLDADLDAEIAKRMIPHIKVEEIICRPKAEIIQIHDQTLSNSALLHSDKAEELRNGVRTIIDREVKLSPNGKVLVVATKAVLAALFEDVGQSFSSTDVIAKPQLLLSAECRWFGPRMLGVNDYQDFSTIVTIGRMQPNVTDIEDNLRAVFGDLDAPLVFATNKSLERAQGCILHADRSSVSGSVQIHPDPRGQAIVRQIREASTEQAIARLRLMFPEENKRIVILSNVPLQGLPSNQLVKFSDLVLGRSEVESMQPYKRLKKAVFNTRGRQLKGLRTSSTGLVEDAPHEFAGEYSGTEFLKKKGSQVLMDLLRQLAELNELTATPVKLRKPRKGGHVVRAVVFGSPFSAKRIAGELWAGHECEITDWEGNPVIYSENNEVIEAE